MSKFTESVTSAFVTGLLILAPVYLGVLLLLKIMQSMAGLVRPIARLLPDWLPAEGLLSVLLVLLVCLVVGLLVRPRAGQAMRERGRRVRIAWDPGNLSPLDTPQPEEMKA